MKTKPLRVFLLLLAVVSLQSQVSKKSKQQELNEILGSSEAKAVTAQVFVQDVIVQGSICVGLDCVNGESFGFDTERLKENNLRIKFQDTSVSASFPSNDWEIQINESTNGGENHFAILDVNGGRTPFKIVAGAPNSALWVDAQGDVGIGEDNPVVELHLTDGDTPTYRLEQDGSAGFQAQTWDLAGNETNFFIRDVTNGSKLPFRIFPNAPDKSFEIGPNGVTIKNVSLIQPSAPSDLRLKEEIKPLSDITSLLMQLYPKSYYFKKEFINNNGFPKALQYGLVAQEVEKVLPSLVGLYSDNDLKTNYKSLNYSAFVPLLIQGFKEQEKRIAELEKELQAYSSLEKRVMELESASRVSRKKSNAKR